MKGRSSEGSFTLKTVYCGALGLYMHEGFGEGALEAFAPLFFFDSAKLTFARQFYKGFLKIPCAKGYCSVDFNGI